MAKKTLPLSEVYRLIEPGPVVMLSTMRGEQPNVMTMSWHMMIEFEPPMLACVLSNRDYTFDTLKKTKQCVVNVPAAKMAKKIVGCGNTSRRDVDKFQKFGLAYSMATKVRAPLLEECYANLECKVVDTSWVEKYGIFILEVVKAWIDPAQKKPKTLHHRGKGVFAVDGEILRLRSRMK